MSVPADNLEIFYSFYAEKLSRLTDEAVLRKKVFWKKALGIYAGTLFLGILFGWYFDSRLFFPASLLLVFIIFIKDLKSRDIVSENAMLSLTTSFVNKDFTFLPPPGASSVSDMRLSALYPEAGEETFYGGVSGNLDGALVNVSFVKVTKNTVIKIAGTVSGLIFVLVFMYLGSKIFSALEPGHWVSRYFGAGAGLLFAYIWLSEFNGITLKRRTLFDGLLIKCDFNRRFPAKTYILSKPISENFQSAIDKLVLAGGGEVQIDDKFFSDKFTVYSADPVSTEHFLTRRAAEGFSALTECLGEAADFSFNGSVLYIALPRGYLGTRPGFDRKDPFGSLASFYGSISGILNILRVVDMEKRFWNNP